MFATKECVNGTFEILCYRTPRGDRLKWDTRAYFGTYIITREYLIHGTSDDGSLSYRVAYNQIMGVVPYLPELIILCLVLSFTPPFLDQNHFTCHVGI